jgi:DNA polymerase-3 subunit epsilon
VPPWAVIETLLATAETVLPGPGPLPAALAEETECILRWLEEPGTRLVHTSEPWFLPAAGAGGVRDVLAAAGPERRSSDPFADRRGLRPVGQPVRALRSTA